MKMTKLFGEEVLELVNHTTGESKELIIREVEDISQIQEIQASVTDGEFEMQYLSGCLMGDACDYFIDLAELAISHQTPLATVGKIFNACDGLNETEQLLEQKVYQLIRAKSEGLAFGTYMADEVPDYLRFYIDFDKWLNDSAVRVVKTHAIADSNDCYEYVVYDLF